MHIQFAWLDEAKTILIQRFEPGWTWEEFFAANDESRAMALSVPYRVDAIVDFQGTYTPRGGSAMTNGRVVMRRRAPNMGVIVTINNAFMTALLNTFKVLDKELGSVMRGATSVEQAVQVIQQEREKILAAKS
jgi:hypothetical protein